MIIYKSDNKVAPSWLKKPFKRDCKSFFMYCDYNPTYWPNVDSDWLPMDSNETDEGNPDSGIEYFKLGEFEPLEREYFDARGLRYIKTPCGSSVPVYPAIDRTGAVWIVPLIVNDGGPTLALQWTDENGAIERKPSKLQNEILTTCETIKEAFLSDEGLEQLPVRMAARACGLILSYSYHAHPSEFLRFGVLDDHLVSRLLLAAVGQGTPEHPFDADINEYQLTENYGA